MKAFFRCVAALTLALALAGCQTEVSTDSSSAEEELSAYFGSAASAVSADTIAKPARPAAAAAAESDLADSSWADACAANLDEIAGALLDYYSLHGKLPPTLDDIPKISPSGAKISLTCPASGKRDMYHPEGLKPPLFTDQNGETHVGGILILYDPEPSHEVVVHLTNGTEDYDVKKAVHLGIVMEPRNGNANQPLQMSVEHIEPGILEMYLRLNPSAATAPAPTITPVW